MKVPRRPGQEYGTHEGAWLLADQEDAGYVSIHEHSSPQETTITVMGGCFRGYMWNGFGLGSL